MTRILFAALIATASLCPLSLSAYEGTDNHDTAVHLQIALDDNIQAGSTLEAYENLTVSINAEPKVTTEAASENLCNAKTFCPLD
jgi:hypothetical protein